MSVRVFVVEDAKPMQKLLADLMESVGGFEVVGMCADETSATEWLLRHRGGWDLAIVDLLLAEGSGFTLITRMNKEPGGAVVVFSDFVTEVVRERCVRFGADGVISKAQFGQLRSYLQAFPGRIQQTETA